MSVEMLSL